MTQLAYTVGFTAHVAPLANHATGFQAGVGSAHLAGVGNGTSATGVFSAVAMGSERQAPRGASALPQPLWPPYHVIHLCCCPLRVVTEAAQHVHCLVAGQEAKGYRKRAGVFPRCEGVLRPTGQGGAGLEPV
jgi:hypothetical protein